MNVQLMEFFNINSGNIADLQYIAASIIIVIGFSIGTILSVMLKSSCLLFVKKEIVQIKYRSLKIYLTFHYSLSSWVGLCFSTFNFTSGSGFDALGITVAKVLSYFGIILGGLRVADMIQVFLVGKAEKTVTKYDDLLAPLIGRTVKIIIVIVGVLSIAEILSLPLASLLTGLGIGGIAIAMAAKDTIANIFGSVTVVSDRPQYW